MRKYFFRPFMGLALALCATSLLAGVTPRVTSHFNSEDASSGETLQLEVDGRILDVTSTSNSITDVVVRAGDQVGPVVVTWTESKRNGAPRTMYTISMDRKKVDRVVEADYTLHLRAGNIDPLTADSMVEGPLQAPPNSRLYLVQYWTQATENFSDEIVDLGGIVHRFLPNYTHLVEMDRQTAAAVEELSFVRWMGPFHTAYKIDENLLDVAQDDGLVTLNLLTMRRGDMGHSVVAGLVEELGGKVIDSSPATYLMTVTVARDQILTLAANDEVQWIDEWSAPEVDMDIARAFHGADYVETLEGFTGQGLNVEVMDGGTEEDHPDMQNYILHTNNSEDPHGTACSGIVVGSGENEGSARGVIPDALLVIADYDFVSSSQRYNHTSELVDPNDQFRCVLQSNSWGSGRTRSYTSLSQDLDLIIFDHERIGILQSQSNAGNQDSRPQAWAKNVISVGGIWHKNTLDKSDDSWSDPRAQNASTGPAADGRIKPDISSFYDFVYCNDMVGSAGYSSGNYANFSGTSAATPVVAGHLGVIYQMWGEGVFGNPTPGSDYFDARPANTTAKALLIASASQWQFQGATVDKTRIHQGWGHPDLRKAYDNRNNILVIDETDVLSNLQSTVYDVTVDQGTPELKATLVYRDWPGTTSSSLHRINNMDLRVTSPSGTVYWGNNGLRANNYSTPGGTANNVDTVENVFIENPEVGTWQVEVIAAELNQDTHPETSALDADYALVVLGPNISGNSRPTASFTFNTNLLTADFTDTSTDADGTVVEWLWEFGDGASSTDQNPSHTYVINGTYTVTLSASDNEGGTSTVSQDVTVSDGTLNVGNLTKFGDVSTSVNRRAMPFTMPETGTISSVTIWHAGGTGDMILAVYTGNGTPDARVGVTPTTRVNSDEGYQTINLTTPAQVAEGTTIWLAWVFSNMPGVAYTSGTPGRADAGADWAGGMPDPFGSSTEADFIYTIFATYTTTPAIQYNLTTNTVGQGSISLNPAGGTYNEGTTVTATAIPAAGWQFDGWSGDASGTSTSTSITMDGNKNITATFSLAPVQYDLATNTVGQGNISLSPAGGTYAEGTTVSANAKPADGWQFDGWSGDASGTDTAISILMDRNKSITATFSQIAGQFTLATNTVGQGSISLNPAGGTYADGTTVSATATPAAGWQFSGWSGDATSSTNPISILMDRNKSITASFSQVSSPGTVGITSVFGSISANDNRRAMPFVMPENGTLESISIYHEGGFGVMYLAVYEGNSAPGNRLGITSPTIINSGSGWQTINLKTPVTVSGGTQIWLAWVFSDNPGVRYQTGTPGRADSGVDFAGGMPSNFGVSTQAPFQYSIYADYAPSLTGSERKAVVQPQAPVSNQISDLD